MNYNVGDVEKAIDILSEKGVNVFRAWTYLAISAPGSFSTVANLSARGHLAPVNEDEKTLAGYNKIVKILDLEPVAAE